MVQEKKFDIAIIGAGVVGSAIARELSRYNVNVVVFEKESDVAQGASNSNSGVVHSGFTCPVGSLKAKVCMDGNRSFEALAAELDVPYKKIGKFVVAMDRSQLGELYKLKKIGEGNGQEYSIIGEEELKSLEPNIKGKAALYSPNSAITSPYEFTIALAENAVKNGVNLLLNTRVEEIKEGKNNSFIITTNRGDFQADYVINSAGLYSDEIARFSGETRYKIYPCRGEYYVLDKNASNLISRLVYPVPPKNAGGFGIHLTPTVDGNILIGPSNEYIDEKTDEATSSEVMRKLLKEAQDFVPRISRKDIIRSYAGIRSKIVPPEIGGFTDYVIEESPNYDNFINLIGIESPGLTASPGIAKYVVEMINKRTKLEKNPDFDGRRKGPVIFDQLPAEEKRRLIKENPNYADLVCRCEKVTKQEIIDALNNPLGVKNLKGIKYRARATMGRCQGGYCMSRIIKIMEDEFGIDVPEMTLKGEHSNLFADRAKGVK